MRKSALTVSAFLFLLAAGSAAQDGETQATDFGSVQDDGQGLEAITDRRTRERALLAEKISPSLMKHSVGEQGASFSLRAESLAEVDKNLIESDPGAVVKQLLIDLEPFSKATDSLEIRITQTFARGAGTSYRFHQLVNGLRAGSGIIEVGPEGRVGRIEATLVDPEKVDDFAIREEEAISIAKRRLYSLRGRNDLVVVLAPSELTNGTSKDQFYESVDNEAVPFWRLKVLVVEPGANRRNIETISIHGLTGESKVITDEQFERAITDAVGDVCE